MTEQTAVPVDLYIEGMLAAIPCAVTRLLAVDRCWIVEAPAGGALQVKAGPPLPRLPCDESFVREAMRSTEPRILQSSQAVLAVPLAFESHPVYCLCCTLAAGRPPVQQAQQVGQAIAEVAGAALEAIRELRGLLEDASEGIVVCDQDGNYIDVNRATCELIGYEREELLKLNYRDLLSEEEARTRPVRYPALRGGQTNRAERLLVRKDGEEVVVELSGRQIAGGRFIALARDISARRRAETALRESEERYRALTEATFDAICLHEDGVVFEANHSFADSFGYTREELIGMHLQQLTDPSDWPRVSKLIAQGYGRPYEALVVRKDGSVFHAEVCARTVQYQNRQVRLVAGRDITERKLAELELRRIASERRQIAARVIAAQEEERIALARELHDHIGQMLAVLKMEINWLGERSASPEQIAERMDVKVSEMLAVVRDLSHRLRPAVLDDLGLDCAIETLSDEISAHSDIELECSIEPCEQLPPEIATALYRIAQEALSNMVRHADARRCWISLDSDGELIRLRIEHDGIVVDAARLANGRSLGVASMRERATLLDGALTITPRPSGGTVLTTQIPLRSVNGNGALSDATRRIDR